MSESYSPMDVTDNNNPCNYSMNYNHYISKYYKYINSIHPNHFITTKKCKNKNKKKKIRVVKIEPPPEKQFLDNKINNLKICVNLVPSGILNWNNEMLYSCD